LVHIRARRRVSCVRGARSLIPCALHGTVALLNGAVSSMHDDTVTSVHGAMSPLHGAIKAKFHYRDPTGLARTRTDPHGLCRRPARNRNFTARCRVIGLGRDDVRRRYRRRGCEHVDRTRREIDHDHRCTHSAFVALANLRYINALNNNNNN